MSVPVAVLLLQQLLRVSLAGLATPWGACRARADALRPHGPAADAFVREFPCTEDRPPALVQRRASWSSLTGPAVAASPLPEPFAPGTLELGVKNGPTGPSAGGGRDCQEVDWISAKGSVIDVVIVDNNRLLAALRLCASFY